jgi:hypothetical protein
MSAHLSLKHLLLLNPWKGIREKPMYGVTKHLVVITFLLFKSEIILL